VFKVVIAGGDTYCSMIMRVYSEYVASQKSKKSQVVQFLVVPMGMEISKKILSVNRQQK
jgi:hypothetical protein